MSTPSRPRESRGVVVTGSGGISEATAAVLLDAGDRVHVIARRVDHTGFLTSPRAGLTMSVADLSDDEQTHAAFADAARSLGTIDGLVAVAGGSARRLGDGAVDGITSAALHANVDLNLATTLNALREFIALGDQEPPGHRSAVLIGSALARHPASPLFVTHGYAALKAATEGLAITTAAHYADRRITVNVVAPGLTRTPMAERAQQDPIISEYARRRQPLADDGFIDPIDVAEACAWLLRARTVTGQVITVDAGWSVFG